nr:hypothetical protein Iba_scaffold9163CG0030 [Ipomoea batatas]
MVYNWYDVPDCVVGMKSGSSFDCFPLIPLYKLDKLLQEIVPQIIQLMGFVSILEKRNAQRKQFWKARLFVMLMKGLHATPTLKNL